MLDYINYNSHEGLNSNMVFKGEVSLPPFSESLSITQMVTIKLKLSFPLKTNLLSLPALVSTLWRCGCPRLHTLSSEPRRGPRHTPGWQWKFWWPNFFTISKYCCMWGAFYFSLLSCQSTCCFLPAFPWRTGWKGRRQQRPGSHSSLVLIPRAQHICQVTVRVRRNWPFQGLFLTFQSQLPG